MSAKHCEIRDAREGRAALTRTAFGCPRDFLGNRFVYIVISPRARGLSIGLNLNPDRSCNFDCVYCEVNRAAPVTEHDLDVSVMAAELEKTLLLIRSGAIRRMAGYEGLSADLIRLHHVAFSGEGEPTLCARFAQAVEAVVHLRARGLCPFFKVVLITNGTGLDLEPVRQGLQYFTPTDEIWIKLDAGTQAYMDLVNRSEVPLTKVLENIRLIGRKRPIFIQSLFAQIAGQEPPETEIDEYIQRLSELKRDGANIALVQIYSPTRPTMASDCRHLPLKTLTRICHRVKAQTGLKAEVF